MDSNEKMAFSIPPIIGDVIFCTGNPFIKAAQSLPAYSNKEITHVAIMASSSEIAEAMAKRKVCVVNFNDWVTERRANGRKEKHYILRSEAAIERGIDIQRRIAFYLKEPYGLRSVRDWTKPGGSICTSFVGKVLSTADVVSEQPGSKILLPGKLFKHLEQRNFRQVNCDAFFTGAEKQPEDSLFESTTELMDILDELEPTLADTQRQMVGWTSVVEAHMKRDPFTALRVWQGIADKGIVPFCEDLGRTCKTLMECASLLELRGPRNWQNEFSAHEARIEMLRHFAAEHVELIRLFSLYLSKEYVQNSVENQPIEFDKEIYTNVAQYIGGIVMAAGTIRVILGTT